MTTTTVYDCSMIELSQNLQSNGRITAINGKYDIPFDIERVYYLYDVPSGESRGGHAHKELQQLIVSLSGSFDLIIDDGKNKRVIHLNRPFMGVIMPPGLWRELNNFSSCSICLVLASHVYDEADYIRSYDSFLRYKQSK